MLAADFLAWTMVRNLRTYARSVPTRSRVVVTLYSVTDPGLWHNYGIPAVVGLGEGDDIDSAIHECVANYCERASESFPEGFQQRKSD